MSVKPEVSIIILVHDYPHNIARLLPSLQKTSDVVYETVVVDNGSTNDVGELLESYYDCGWIDTLVSEPVNHFFSEGNNIGVCHSDPQSEFVLLLNSDIEITHSLWLRRAIEWADGVPKTLLPYTWSDYPTKPIDIRRGIVSLGWCYNTQTLRNMTPDGFCCLIRREAWQEIDPDFPMAFGIMKMLASSIRDGHPCGVLSQYGKYFTHYNQGSTPTNFLTLHPEGIGKRKPKMLDWWKNLEVESLDFTLGPHERQTYMEW